MGGAWDASVHAALVDVCRLFALQNAGGSKRLFSIGVVVVGGGGVVCERASLLTTPVRRDANFLTNSTNQIREFKRSGIYERHFDLLGKAVYRPSSPQIWAFVRSQPIDLLDNQKQY